MAALVKCDLCGIIVQHNKAAHVRAYKMTDATSFSASDVRLTADICSTCLNSLNKKIRSTQSNVDKESTESFT